MFVVLLVIVCLISITAEQACNPFISDTTQNEKESRRLECVLSKCVNVSKVVYEKAESDTSSQWTPVFEGNDKINYTALETGTGYTLQNRGEYTAFRAKHMLYIDPLIEADQGEWRCVVYDETKRTIKSQAIGLYFAENQSSRQQSTLSFTGKLTTVKAADNIPSSTKTTNTIANPIISPNNPSLVVNQTAEFTCLSDGVNFKPDVVWRVDGKEYRHGSVVFHPLDNGLWFVKNAIMLSFDTVGVHVLRCVIKADKENQLQQQHMSVAVKEQARVTHPREGINITTNSTFVIYCQGVGYHPILSWTKDGKLILDIDELYITKQMCDTQMCEGTLISRVDACLNQNEYTGVYSCIISLEPPYQSTQESPPTYVNVPEQLCGDEHDLIVISIAASSVALGIVVVSMSVCCANWRKKRAQDPAYDEVIDPGPTRPPDKSRNIRHSQCSVASIPAEYHTYDVCTTDLEIPVRSELPMHGDDVVYKRMDSQGLATYVTKKDVRQNLHKKINRQGQATHNTKDQLTPNEYLQMDNVSIDKHDDNDAKATSEVSIGVRSDYTSMEHRESWNYANKNVMGAQDYTGKGTPTYINRDADGTSKRKYPDVLVRKLEFDI